MKRGTRKFKGKLPLICFNCRDIGHFAAKCPHNKYGNEDETLEKGKKGQRRFNKQGKKKGCKKIFFSKEGNSSSEEESESDEENDMERALFMARENRKEAPKEEEGDEEEIDKIKF